MHYLNIIIYKTYADLKAEAARKYLGVIWWVLEPLLYLAVFYFVFGYVFNRGGPDYVVFLLCGLVVFKWFASAIGIGSSSVLANAALMRQVYLPKFIFPIVSVLSTMVKFLFVLGVFLVFLTLLYGYLNINWLFIPVLVFVQMLFVGACVGIIAAIMPFLPDLRMLIESGITFMLFLSGIFFDINELSQPGRDLLMMNPMAVIITAYRTVLMDGQLPDLMAIFVVAIVSILGISIAAFIFHKYDRVYPKVVH